MSKYNKEELEKLIFEDEMSYEAIGRQFNVSGTAIKKAAKRLKIQLPIRKVFPDGFEPAIKGTGVIKICLNCNKSYKSEHKSKFCCVKCSGEYRSTQVYKDFIENNDKYCRVNYVPSSAKPYILKEQSYKCDICKIKNTWNDKPLIFVLDHIDGNAANNKRENLRLLCHNCDSQLDTYKSKNKNSARKDRYLRQTNFYDE